MKKTTKAITTLAILGGISLGGVGGTISNQVGLENIALADMVDGNPFFEVVNGKPLPISTDNNTYIIVDNVRDINPLDYIKAYDNVDGVKTDISSKIQVINNGIETYANTTNQYYPQLDVMYAVYDADNNPTVHTISFYNNLDLSGDVIYNTTELSEGQVIQKQDASNTSDVFQDTQLKLEEGKTYTEPIILSLFNVNDTDGDRRIEQGYGGGVEVYNGDVLATQEFINETGFTPVHNIQTINGVDYDTFALEPNGNTPVEDLSGKNYTIKFTSTGLIDETNYSQGGAVKQNIWNISVTSDGVYVESTVEPPTTEAPTTEAPTTEAPVQDTGSYTIAGRIFDDLLGENGEANNNLRDENESLVLATPEELAQFKVTLHDNEGNLIDEKYLDETGKYEFTGLSNGTYKVNFLNPLTWSPVIANIDFDASDDRDSDGPTDARVVIDNNDSLHVDQGYKKGVGHSVNDLPTTEAPTTEAPTTEAPTTEETTTEEPTTEAPTTEEPTTEEPTTEEPTIEDDTVEEDSIEIDTIEEPTIEDDTVEEDTTDIDTTEIDTVEESKVDNLKGIGENEDTNKGSDSFVSQVSDIGDSILPDTGEEKKSLASLALGLGLGGLVMMLFGRKK